MSLINPNPQRWFPMKLILNNKNTHFITKNHFLLTGTKYTCNQGVMIRKYYLPDINTITIIFRKH